MNQAILELILRLKDEASQGLDKVKGSLGGLGDVLGGVAGLAAGAATAGFVALGAAVSGGIADAQAAAQVMAQTEAVIKSTGGAAGYTAQQIADMAGQLSAAEGKSLFGDDDIQKGQNLLLTFTNIKETMPDATAVMVDMAQAMGTDVSSGAMQLGKALNDPIKGVGALSRVGVTFTEEQKEQIKVLQESGDMAGAQAIILAELQKEFGGSAEAAAKANGGWAQINDQWGELWESVGAKILPIMGQFTGFMINTFMPVIESQVIPAVDQFASTVLPMVSQAFTELLPLVQQAGTFFLTEILPALQAVWAFLDAYIIPILVAVGKFGFALLKKEVEFLVALWNTVLMPALQDFWNFVETNIMPTLEAWGLGFDGIGKKLQELAGFFDQLAQGTANLTLPDWLTPGSPTPLEIGLGGIRKQMAALAGTELPRFNAGLDLTAPQLAPVGVTGSGSSGAGQQIVFSGPITVNVPASITDPRQQALTLRDELIRIAAENGGSSGVV